MMSHYTPFILYRLGASHEDEIKGCVPYGGGTFDFPYPFIMSRGQYFYSNCTDQEILKFAKSKEASCLRKIDENERPLLGPTFNGARVPDTTEQCKRLNLLLYNEQTGSNFASRFQGACYEFGCMRKVRGGTFMKPLETSECVGKGVSASVLIN